MDRCYKQRKIRERQKIKVGEKRTRRKTQKAFG